MYEYRYVYGWCAFGLLVGLACTGMVEEKRFVYRELEEKGREDEEEGSTELIGEEGEGERREEV